MKKVRKIVHHLRRQPDDVKKGILNLLTLFFGIILIVIWAYTLGKDLRSPETISNFKSDLEPFADLKNDIVGGTDNSSQSEAITITGQ